ncbi:hypothetical protein SUGI_1189950 [Cryptomeria japonica]|uniref:uncharacterized protein LOC131043485 isoform X1 n=1 Tax=Cryptomeria japonica TaxID=3369 RepID=UPI002414A3F6|nr:uncharacterized protein LOC131043485 isoform X1 [Cryptomeria japonica]GLJ55423.1 hypothetical protein SUGI_1189950 [Cryptomeria japonica]
MEAQAVDKSTEIKSSKKIEIYENKPNIAHSQKAAAVGVETKSKVKAAATDTTTVATIKDEEEKVGVDKDGSVGASSTREIAVTAKRPTSPPRVDSPSPEQNN